MSKSIENHMLRLRVDADVDSYDYELYLAAVGRLMSTYDDKEDFDLIDQMTLSAEEFRSVNLGHGIPNPITSINSLLRCQYTTTSTEESTALAYAIMFGTDELVYAIGQAKASKFTGNWNLERVRCLCEKYALISQISELPMNTLRKIVSNADFTRVKEVLV